jgi:hypothetical protein
MAKISFKKGTEAREASSRVAEDLKRKGTSDNPFALSRYITKRAGPAGRARLAKRGLRGRR